MENEIETGIKRLHKDLGKKVSADIGTHFDNTMHVWSDEYNNNEEHPLALPIHIITFTVYSALARMEFVHNIAKQEEIENTDEIIGGALLNIIQAVRQVLKDKNLT